MNVNQNDIVLVNGKSSRVQTSWGSGAHRTFKLDDGREILDLDKLVAQGKATITQKGETQTFSPPSVEIKKGPPFWPGSKKD